MSREIDQMLEEVMYYYSNSLKRIYLKLKLKLLKCNKSVLKSI